METNKKLSPIVNELFQGGRKLAIPTGPAILLNYKTKKLEAKIQDHMQ